MRNFYKIINLSGLFLQKLIWHLEERYVHHVFWGGIIMYISNIEIENFRGFSVRKVIELNEKLNIFIGHNNSGKTTIIKALQILFDTSYSKNWGSTILIGNNLSMI